MAGECKGRGVPPACGHKKAAPRVSFEARGAVNKAPAASDSPTGLPQQYHRRRWA